MRDPGGDALGEFDTCNYVEEITLGTGDIHIFKVVTNGVTVYVIESKDENGRKRLWAVPNLDFMIGNFDGSDMTGTSEQKEICAGLNNAFKKLYNDKTLDTNSIDTLTLLKDVVSFTLKNYAKFQKMYSGGSPLSTFLTHSVIGGAIKQKMQQEAIYHGDYDHGQYDMEIGFWTSYWSTKYGWNIGFGTSGSGKSAVLGLVDIAFLFKSLMYKENGHMNPNAVYDNGGGNKDYGLSMVNNKTFEDYNNKVKHSVYRIASKLFYSKCYRCLRTKFYSKLSKKSNQKKIFFLQLASFNYCTGGYSWIRDSTDWLQQLRVA
jgi:hypothetical protein